VSVPAAEKKKKNQEKKKEGKKERKMFPRRVYTYFVVIASVLDGTNAI